MNADGAVIIKADIEVGEAEKELAKLRKDIKKTEESVGKQESKKAPLVQQAEEISAKMKEARAQVEMYGQQWRDGVVGADGQQEKAIATLNRLKAQYDGVVSKIDKVDEKLLPAQAKLDAMKDQAGALSQRIAKGARAAEKLVAAMAAAKKDADKFTARIASLMKRVLVFSSILRLLRSFAQWFGKILKMSPETTAAIADLKGALLTLAQPLVEVIIPAFTALVSVLARVITMIARVVSFLFGKTINQSREAAEALNKQTEAFNGVGGSAKKAGKSLASFDEINQLSGDGAGGGGGAGGAGIDPDFSGIQGAMSELEVYISGALLALGAILAFSGISIPLGLTLMAAGALGLASALAVDWDTMPNNLKNAITKTMLVLGGAALVIGAILAFSSADLAQGIGLMVAGAAMLGTAAALNWKSIEKALRGPIGAVTACVSAALLAIGAIITFSSPTHFGLGIGLMAAGAIGLASVVAINWDSIEEALQGPIGKVTAIVSAALLAVGAIITFSSPTHFGLGIGLMAAGAIGLASVVAINWDSIEEALRGPIGAVTALVGSSLLAVGAVLAFSCVDIPLGISLMAAGAVSLATTVSVNWDFITEMMRGKVGLVTAIVSGALLVLGIILLFTGAGIGLGLGLILAGAAGLATVVAFNWDFLSEKVKETWEKVKTFWNEHIAQVFTKEWWLDLAKKCGNGLISGFEAAINGIIGMFESMINGIVDKVNTLSFDVPDWVPGLGGKKFGFGLSRVKFDRVSIPRLAQGAVIPPNREFMAILGDQKSGTNIETPLATMVQAFKQAMAESGGGGQTIILQIDGREFGRAVKKYGGAENQRIGVSLVGGR